jgi:uncharacterized protein YlxW (UPF0749 family)
MWISKRKYMKLVKQIEDLQNKVDELYKKIHPSENELADAYKKDYINLQMVIQKALDTPNRLMFAEKR